MDPRKIINIGSLLALASTNAMAGAPLDGAFYPDWGDSGGGTVSAKFVSDPYDYWAGISDVVALPDGSSIVVGSVGVTDDIGLLRLTPKGEPDPAFGVGGFATIKDDLWLSAYDAVLDKDGMLLLAGSRFQGPVGDQDFSVCRVNPATGAPVVFAGGGQSCVSIAFDEKFNGLRRSYAGSVLALPDGSTVLTGNLYKGDAPEDFSFVGAMVRLAPDGTPDAGFGTGGKRTFLVPQSAATGLAKCDRASNGKLICAVGIAEGMNPMTGFSRILRFSANGEPEMTWSGGSDINIPNTSSIFFTDFALLDNPASVEDDIVALGNGEDDQGIPVQAFASRISGATGTLVPQFGNAGMVLIPDWVARGKAFIVQPGIGFIVAATESNTIVAKRFRFDGGIDATFGNGGTVEIGNSDNQNWFDALRSDGDALYAVGIHTGSADLQGFKPQSGDPTPKTKLIAAKLTLDGIFADGHDGD